MDDKTIWRCPDCLKDGRVDHPADMPMIDVLARVVLQHEQKSPICVTPFGKFQIRMRDE